MAETAPALWAPSIDEVAALIRSRTKDVNGNEVGTFTELTRPTAEQAQEAIDNQVKLYPTDAIDVDSPCAAIASRAVALGAAAEIELAYSGEQIRSDRSPYSSLIQRLSEVRGDLHTCLLGELPGTDRRRWGTIKTPSGVVADYYGYG